MTVPRAQTHGNLASYRAYVRPTTHNMYGDQAAPSKHLDNIHELLHILFVHGACTTWDMAKISQSQIALIRKQDKIYRRLLIGRIDRGKHTGGVLDMGLVVCERTRSYFRYRLSLYGILYCIDVLNPDKKEYDKMASFYAFLLPRIFGDWKRKKKILRDDAYNLRILAQGIFLNNIKFARPDNPLYELMMYLHIKYFKNFESISEHDLSEQISYWFYTFLLYSAPDKLAKILSSDGSLYKWYASFFREARSYYEQRLRSIKNSTIL